MSEVFKNHSRNYKNNLYAYPVISRRAEGLSLGVNLSLRKECNFDCVYCQVDRTEIEKKERIISLEKLKEEIEGLILDYLEGLIFQEERFLSTPEKYKVLKDISFSGDGEPTTSKYFEPSAKIVMDLILKYSPKVAIKPIVITNASTLNKENVKSIFVQFMKAGGGPWLKLDAGSAEEFQKVAETKIPFETIIHNIILFSKEFPSILQTIVYKYANGGFSFAPNTMIETLNNMQKQGARFQKILLYTLARDTRVKNIYPLNEEELANLKDGIEKETGIIVS